jgi:alkylhydroperoxidase/carboxymuconolactone decarboxylase family protein YurZ
MTDASGKAEVPAVAAASDDTARMLAHDLGNLLAIVIGNLDLLSERREIDAGTRELAQASLDAALRGADVVKRLRGARPG